MVGPSGKIYPVPANYASKSKLVEGLDNCKSKLGNYEIEPESRFVSSTVGVSEYSRVKILRLSGTVKSTMTVQMHLLAHISTKWNTDSRVKRRLTV
jgi:hypothetical protein